MVIIPNSRIIALRNFNNETLLYPNPTEGIVTLKTNNSENVSFEVYNSVGMIIHKVEIDVNQSFAFEPYQKGLYLVKVNNTFGDELLNEKVIYK